MVIIDKTLTEKINLALVANGLNMKRWGFNVPNFLNRINFINGTKVGKKDTATPLIYIYCCSALFYERK